MQDIDKFIKDFTNETEREVNGHSEFQIKNFIIGSEPTDYGKYKQCILELRARIKNYQNIKEKLDSLRNKEINSNFKEISELEILIEDILREIYIINSIYEEVKSRIDLTDKDKLEEEYWNAKFTEELRMNVLLGSPIPIKLALNISRLSNDCSVKKELNYMLTNRMSSISQSRQEEKDES